jgi:PTS system nitrogen regulatory IIA component
MEIRDFIAPEGAIHGLGARDKRQTLEELSRRAAAALGLDSAAILAPLLAREELGSTGVGRGIAIPHARIPGLTRPFGLLARLARAIDFAAIDERPVDLVCLLLTPASAAAAHLPALACLSRRLREPGVAERLRSARDQTGLYAIFTGAPAGP